ncbi:TIGR01440 family protein [Halobacillus salinarum]|uniref:UPF0340 protein MUN89_05205 n=1 Tax=Halobacillus salinarum TaxID=2932257 RepID=A0ABY4EMQ5_9BACI|nr:TIGR01440 family protein [Halobacillus salinarum]UOQ45346.1 TIGR01440 family protein [Halobacillus salinarum]
MAANIEAVQADVEAIVEQLIENGSMKSGLLVIGCSTSEVAGEKIGTSGSESIAEVLYEAIGKLKNHLKADIAFQCCEHLNRSLVVERTVQQKFGFTEVSAIPVPKAGGSMASYVYKQFKDPVLVESVEADAGIDIGDTFIGMHLKRVAVPLRVAQKSIGKAHVTCATTRPPLIGGVRAVYENSKLEESCD